MRSFCLAVFFLVSGFGIANSEPQHVRNDSRNPVISHIPRDRVSSSVIASIGYSKQRHVLEIEFLNGAVYRDLQVAPSVYREIMSADSKARYYVTNIKGNYPSVHIRPRAKDQTD
jgi:hypothetical protein